MDRNRIANRTSRVVEIAGICCILFLAVVLRFYDIQTRPGYEWDEPVYASIAGHVADHGYPALQPEANEEIEAYTYHPPFDFYVKGWWFQLVGDEGVGAARVVAGAASIIMLVAVYLCVKYVASLKAGLLALILLATDGWLVFTNRLNLFENIMMPIGILGILAYAMAVRRGHPWMYVLAGSVLSFAFVYKHTGVGFLLVPAIYWLMTRESTRQHLMLLATAGVVIVAYVSGMYLAWGDTYLNQSWVQVQRAIGSVESRGLNYGVQTALEAVVERYWLFTVSILFLVAGVLLSLFRLAQQVFQDRFPAHPLLLSWSLAATVSLGAIALRAPQYLVIVLVPFYALLATELAPYLAKRRIATAGIIVLIIAVSVNLVTWNVRFNQQDENALLGTYRYAERFIPADAAVLTEESIGVGIEQPYFKLDTHVGQSDLRRIEPAYVILYFSTTHGPPRSPALDALVEQSQLVASFSGFKENIRVYDVPR